MHTQSKESALILKRWAGLPVQHVYQLTVHLCYELLSLFILNRVLQTVNNVQLTKGFINQVRRDTQTKWLLSTCTYSGTWRPPYTQNTGAVYS